MYTYKDVCMHNHIKHRFKRLPVVDKKDIVPLYTMGHYDGVRSAMGLYKGIPVYMSCESSIDLRKPRRFWLVEIPEDIFIYYQIRHALFRQYVGHHTDLNGSWSRKSSIDVFYQDDRESHKKFYEDEFMQISDRFSKDLNDCRVIGWFESFSPPEE
jgi:hypothetical protein